MCRLFIVLAAISLAVGSCTNHSGSASNNDTTKAMASNTGANTDMWEKNKTTALAAEEAVNNHDADGLI